MKELFEKNGYIFKPYEGPSGRRRYRKDLPNGIIFFFISDLPSGFIHLMVRKVKNKYLETVYENTFNASVFKEDEIKEAEYLFNVL